ncbi:MAG: hypothetical protein HYU66_14980 [Armatimonadetes bacterium]|nr:hypothetical protein [Armatimonadota bacterium]
MATTDPPVRPPRGRGCLTLGLTLTCLFVYTLVVAYDMRCWTVFQSAWHYWRFPVDPGVAPLLPDAPGDVTKLEDYVDRRLPWARDADVFGLPWYFPTPREAVGYGRGDCEAQAVVLASILAARGVPYAFRASFSHLWVDYPGKPPVAGELPAEAMMLNVEGHYRFHWPELPELAEHLRNQKYLLWDGLAPPRKVLLLLGWPSIAMGLPLRRRRRAAHVNAC